MSTWEEHKASLYMPDDDTQSLADVLDAMRRGDLQRQAAFVEWLAASLSEMDDVADARRQLAHLLELEANNLREAVEALVDVMPYCHPNPSSPHATKWEEWRQAALDKAALALGGRHA